MNLHSLKNVAGARHSSKRVGRGHGSGTGKTSGRGHKGQKSRSGYSRKLGFEGGQMPLTRRLPKRGFKNYNRKVFQPVNVATLNSFADGAEVNPEILRSAGLINGPIQLVKILGVGEIEHKLTVKAHGFSASARAKIEAAGGTCELMA